MSQCTVHVKVVEARNLRGNHSSRFCDPYCRVQIGDDKKKYHKTKAIKKTLNPKWQEIFVFEKVNKDDKVGVEIRDWTVMNSKVIGIASFSLSSVPLGPTPHEYWLPIMEGKEGKERGEGEIHLLIAMVTGSENVNMDVRLASHQEVEEGNAILVLEVLEGRNLAIKDLTGTSDPYCVINVLSPSSSSSSSSLSSSSSPARSSSPPPSSGIREQKTSIVFKSLDPTWNEEFFFQLPFTGGTLVVEVWDWDRIGSHDAMGCVKMDINNFFDEAVHDEWRALVPIKREKVSGEIRLRAQFTSALNAQKSYQTAKNHLAQLCKIITDQDCILATALLQLYESQELARALVAVFQAQHAVNSLLNHCFHRDLQRTTAETTLFRTDSPATRTTIVFFKNEDKKSSWLSKTLLPLIQRVLQSPAGYEVDPEKAKEDKIDIQSNAKNLLATSQQFLDSIIGSLELCPPSIRLVLSNLRRLVTQAFPQSGLTAVGGIIFLRFICPAIFAPEGFGLVTRPPSAEARRSLTLIAKILQNLVNGVEFGGKEQFMVGFNPFIFNNSRRITEFLDRLSLPPSLLPSSPVGGGVDERREEEVVRSVSVVVKNMTYFEKVEAAVMRDPWWKKEEGGREGEREGWKEEGREEEIRLQMSQLRAILTS